MCSQDKQTFLKDEITSVSMILWLKIASKRTLMFYEKLKKGFDNFYDWKLYAVRRFLTQRVYIFALFKFFFIGLYFFVVAFTGCICIWTIFESGCGIQVSQATPTKSSMLLNHNYGQLFLKFGYHSFKFSFVHGPSWLRVLESIHSKASTETYLLELTPYKGLCIGVCLLNGR